MRTIGKDKVFFAASQVHRKVIITFSIAPSRYQALNSARVVLNMHVRAVVAWPKRHEASGVKRQLVPHRLSLPALDSQKQRGT
jgi:dipeptide/tripeptide permease